ncbi:hypothetical protein POX_c04711 [Penicillium oxalicum]|uniref:Uncharacterized protein n=1 Tax=Penicillium oxalicum (strain 114-2 / CGMCC 5302) TaxID=933388 RepID=S7Z6Q9_PENO1|nr:hypothetical protein POX_c04711 [Penicillium oxalicum]EPS26245.1 hypothetical protein PDE_01181 [Penicillium oxalicum 114-2]KAI2791832.1 hypothetical protein POX_c04711 [Penicillium oxalicum]
MAYSRRAGYHLGMSKDVGSPTGRALMIASC